MGPRTPTPSLCSQANAGQQVKTEMTSLCQNPGPSLPLLFSGPQLPPKPHRSHYRLLSGGSGVSAGAT